MVPVEQGVVPGRAFHGSPCPLVVVGAWQLSSGHSDRVACQPHDETLESLKAHRDAGLFCFDCADIYTGVEALLGEVVAGSDGTGIRVHTKCVPDLDAIRAGLVKRDYLEAGITRSLNRLKVKSLDMVQLHWWDYDASGFAEAFEQLHALRTDGLIGAVGLTNTDLQRMKDLAATGHAIASNQVQFSLLDRRAERSGMTAYCAEHGVELICYGVLAGGFLTDRWLGRDDPGFDDLENRSLVKYRLVIDEYGSWEDFQRLLRCLKGVAERRAVSVADASCAWTMQSLGGSGRILLGARGAAHVAGMARCLRTTLLPEDVAELNAEIAGRGIGGEVFGAERAGGRHTGKIRQNLNGVGGAGQLEECLARAEKGKGGEIPDTMRREVELLRRLGNDVTAIQAVLDEAGPVGKRAKTCDENSAA